MPSRSRLAPEVEPHQLLLAHTHPSHCPSGRWHRVTVNGSGVRATATRLTGVRVTGIPSLEPESLPVAHFASESLAFQSLAVVHHVRELLCVRVLCVCIM